MIFSLDVLFEWKGVLIDFQDVVGNSPLKEEIYVLQSEGFVKKVREDFVHFLKNPIWAMSGLARMECTLSKTFFWSSTAIRQVWIPCCTSAKGMGIFCWLSSKSTTFFWFRKRASASEGNALLHEVLGDQDLQEDWEILSVFCRGQRWSH